MDPRPAAPRAQPGLDPDDVRALGSSLGLDASAPPGWFVELLDEIASSADPVGTTARLGRVTAAAEAQGSAPLVVEALAGSAAMRRALVATSASSRSIAAHLAAHPDDVLLLHDLAPEPEHDPVAAIAAAREAIAAARVASPARMAGGAAPAEAAGEAGGGTGQARGWVDALRMHKRRQYLLIAGADLLGVASLEAVGAALAALAEACLTCALEEILKELRQQQLAVAVIGMGKLGASELNYASDVDVLFVCDGEHAVQAATEAARNLISAVSGSTPVDTLFRVDADLRPEGRAGPLVRTLDSYRAYWKKWAAPWEFQALIKARPVAGDPSLSEAFVDAGTRFVWPAQAGADAIGVIRSLKARAEAEVTKKGLEGRELKRGPGGIRDVEFSIQLLQLVHGRHDPALRQRGTLAALQALADGGYVGQADAGALGAAYRFLRTVEHRLQLRDERQVHTLPTAGADLDHLARTLGFRDRDAQAATDALDVVLTEHTTTVRRIHERLFFRPLLEAFAEAPADAAAVLSQEAAAERLQAFGFRKVEAARIALAELTQGLSRASGLMQQLLPLMLNWLSASPDPDLGLLGLRNLVGAVKDKANLITTFRENPPAAQRLCTVLGTSRVLGDLLIRQPEALGALADERALSEAKSPAALVEEARHYVGWRASFEEKMDSLRRFRRREFLGIGHRDLLAGAALGDTARELAALGEAVLDCALAACAERSPGPPLEIAVIGMGSLGGQEMNYSSDLDVILVYDAKDPGATEVFERALAIATLLINTVGGVTAEGIAFRIDADLRPEGRSGPLVRSLESTLQYYQRWADTWEFQALTRARPVAGDTEIAERLLGEIEPLVWPDPFPAEQTREIRMMKARMERERIPRGEDPAFHLKLGPGGLSDVEFAAQLLALRHGGAEPELRRAGTLDTLEALAERGLLEAEDAGRLVEAYTFCNRVRNRLFLIKGRQVDSLPTDPTDAERLAESLGYVESPRQSLREEYRRVTRRARAVFEKVFYSDNSGGPGGTGLD